MFERNRDLFAASNRLKKKHICNFSGSNLAWIPNPVWAFSWKTHSESWIELFTGKMFGFCREEKVELVKMDPLLHFAWLQVKNRSVMAINAVETTLAKLKSDSWPIEESWTSVPYHSEKKGIWIGHGTTYLISYYYLHAKVGRASVICHIFVRNKVWCKASSGELQCDPANILIIKTWQSIGWYLFLAGQ